MLIIPVFIICLIIILFISYFISANAYKKMIKSKNQYARLFQIILFICCTIALSYLCIYYLEHNVRFER